MFWLRPFVVILALLAVHPSVLAQSPPEFPQLTGRVVDQADMLSSKVEADLTQTLAAHEEATSNQVVVVTLPDLQGRTIEEYGYQLGRHWGIGQEGEDNGVLLIVAEEERAIRIEVGYGLEGQLTDAASFTIINRIITPAFRQGEFAGGIVQGTEAILQVLGGNPLDVPAAQTSKTEKPNVGAVIMFFVIIVAFIGLVGGRGGGRGGRGRGALIAGALIGAGMGGRGGGFGGGGFGGGGGGFGGGGASGGW